jgi:hypothetical protein
MRGVHNYVRTINTSWAESVSVQHKRRFCTFVVGQQSGYYREEELKTMQDYLLVKIHIRTPWLSDVVH